MAGLGLTPDGLAYTLQTCATYGAGMDTPVARKLGFSSNKVVSDMYRSLVTPAGWAFAIWGPIFALEGYSVLAGTGLQGARDPQAASLWWQRACAFQGAWSLVFAMGARHPAFVVAGAPILGGIAFSMREVYMQVVNQHSLSLATRVGFPLHACWTGIAAILNVNLACRAMGMSATSTAGLLLAGVSEVTAVAIGASTALAMHDSVYAWVTAWALLGIVSKQQDSIRGKAHKEDDDMSPVARRVLPTMIVGGRMAAAGMALLGLRLLWG